MEQTYSDVLQEVKLIEFDVEDTSSELICDLSELLEDDRTLTRADYSGGRLREAMPFSLQKLSHTHLSIMDFMLANPALPQSEVAAHFGYTQAWLSTLIHSDVFVAQFRKRRQSWEAIHDHTLAGKLHAVATKSLDTLMEILSDEENRPSPSAANEIAKTALSALGYSGKQVATPSVQVNQTIITQEDALAARRVIMHG